MHRLNARHFALAAALATLPACGDDPTEPTDVQCGDDVAGVYEPTTLTFDVNGNLPEKDILERIDRTLGPDLNIDRIGGFQLAFRDPASGQFTTVEGTCTRFTDGIRLEFDEAAEAQRLLLPPRLPLDHDADAGTLAFQGSVSVSRERLKELVPEFADEPLADPVPGDLAVVFELSGE